MRTLLLIAFVVLGSLALAGAIAARPERSAYLDCKELLDTKEAAEVLDAEKAAVLRDDFAQGLRDCVWIGGSPAIKGSVEVIWGSYASFRAANIEKGRKLICLADEAACKAYDVARTVKSEAKSFAALFTALGFVGKAQWLPPSFFEGNRAFVWDPGDELVAKFGETSRVFVYHGRSGHLLEAMCSHYPTAEFDHHCSIRAARLALYNATG
jgi:hypothetical protein